MSNHWCMWRLFCASLFLQFQRRALQGRGRMDGPEFSTMACTTPLKRAIQTIQNVCQTHTHTNTNRSSSQVREHSYWWMWCPNKRKTTNNVYTFDGSLISQTRVVCTRSAQWWLHSAIIAFWQFESWLSWILDRKTSGFVTQKRSVLERQKCFLHVAFKHSFRINFVLSCKRAHSDSPSWRWCSNLLPLRRPWFGSRSGKLQIFFLKKTYSNELTKNDQKHLLELYCARNLVFCIVLLAFAGSN